MGAGLAGSVDRVVGVHLINDVGMNVGHRHRAPTAPSDTAHLLPRLIAGRQAGPLFLSEYRSGPARKATTDPKDICPETGRARLGYDRARILLGHYGDGPRLHQLRHSAATHLGRPDTTLP